MQQFNKFIKKNDIALAIGFFDGVHIAHKKVISSCINYAKKNNLKSAVLTFCEHPCVSIWNVVPKYIIPKEDRVKFIEELGTDYLYMIDFNHQLSDLSPENFLNLLSSKIAPKAIFTGYNFFFGKNKSGNSETLNKFSGEYNYKYFEIPEQKIDGISISSTNVRKYLQNGDIKMANQLLGYEYSFNCLVTEGKKIGRTINFPTANLIFPEELIPLKYGVYSAKVLYDDVFYDAIMNFGLKPTVNSSNDLSVEVHILDFNKNMYSQNIRVFPKKYIREQKKFDSLNSLKNQILNDLLILKLSKI